MKHGTRSLSILALLLSLTAAPPVRAQADGHPKIDLEKGWRQLFNGKDLAGWETRDTDGKKVLAVEETDRGTPHTLRHRVIGPRTAGARGDC